MVLEIVAVVVTIGVWVFTKNYGKRVKRTYGSAIIALLIPIEAIFCPGGLDELASLTSTFKTELIVETIAALALLWFSRKVSTKFHLVVLLIAVAILVVCISISMILRNL